MKCHSHELMKRAYQCIPGGVNSPVRAFRAVDMDPFFVVSGQGAYVTTVEGQSLVDFCGSWGPLIMGHAHDAIVTAIQEAATRGTTFGINTEAEILMAEKLCDMIPGVEQVRLVSSGTEAVMTALRLARGVTGRQRILKFDGCYHGHSDCMLVSAGSGLLTGGIHSSAGVPPETAADVFVIPYNDLEAAKTVVEKIGHELACIIIEPIAANMGLVLPDSGFLEGLRLLADQCGALLVFDEVITGFRLGPSTAGHIMGIRPDLTVLGKIIGGGMPMGAVGGSADTMRSLAPEGPVYQAGTLSGNPLAVAAGLTMLNLLQRENPYDRLARQTAQLASGIQRAAEQTGYAEEMLCQHTASLFTVFFKAPPAPRHLGDVRMCDTKRYGNFFRGLVERGFYLPPSQFETGFLSASHTESQIEQFCQAVHETLKTLSGLISSRYDLGTTQCF